MTRTRRSAPGVAAVSALAVAVSLSVVGCDGTPDPFASPACKQIPSEAIRANVTDLGTSAQTTAADHSGPEVGVLPATDYNGLSYGCYWPAANPDDKHSVAFSVVVRAKAVNDLAIITESVMHGHQGPLLTSTAPGQGRAWVEGGTGVATWVCPRRPRDYSSQYLTVGVSRPKHPKDAAGDAKALAEVVIPLIGCPTAGATTTATPGSGTPATTSTP